MKKFKKLLYCSLFIVIIGFILNIFVINPNVIQVRQEKYQSKLVNKDLNDFTILFFSDTFYGTNINAKEFNKLVKQINDYNADLVIFGGDLINRPEQLDEENKAIIEKALASIDTNYGKFAVIGDNDATTSTSRNITTEILNNSGFEVLNNKNTTITVKNSYFNLVGIDPSVNGTVDLDASFKDIDLNKLTIAISHTPDVVDTLGQYKPQIMLAGHSLGGQIYLPLITKQFMYEGCLEHFHGKKLVNDTLLDISNGVASTKSTRLFADAEIVIYKLKTN